VTPRVRWGVPDMQGKTIWGLKPTQPKPTLAYTLIHQGTALVGILRFTELLRSIVVVVAVV